MGSSPRCVRCLEPVDTDTAARYLTFVRWSDADADLPASFVACAECAPAIEALTDEWTPGLFTRACSFCGRETASEDVAVVDGGGVDDGVEAGLPAYALCPACQSVFAVFLDDTRRDALRGDVPETWYVETDGDALCAFRGEDRRVAVTVTERGAYAVRADEGDGTQRLAVTDTVGDALARCRSYVTDAARPE